MRIKLTDKLVKQKKLPAPEIWDLILPGFGLRAGKTRRSYFAMARVGGKQVRYTKGLGTTDSNSLAEARAAARIWLAAPTTRKMRRAEAVAAELAAKRDESKTWGIVVRRWLDKPRPTGKEFRSRDVVEQILESQIPADWNDRAIHDITKAEIRQLHEDKGKSAPVGADRILGWIKTVLNYAVDQDLIDINQAAKIKPFGASQGTRILDAQEIKNFWNGMTNTSVGREPTVGPVVRLSLKFILTVGVRRSEAVEAKWSEFNLQPGSEVWHIPGTRTKNRKPLNVPLSSMALRLLNEVTELTRAQQSEYVFPSKNGKPYNPSYVSAAMLKSRQACQLVTNPCTVHDLRRTMASNIAQLGFSREVLKRVLNHTSGDVTDVYDHHRYDNEAKLALEAWSNRLDEILDDAPAESNIVELHN